MIEKSVWVHEVGIRNTVSLDESQGTAEDAEKVQGSTMLRCDWQRQLSGRSPGRRARKLFLTMHISSSSSI